MSLDLPGDPVLEQHRSQTAVNQMRFQLLAMANGLGAVERHQQTAWSSVTFTGTRHESDLKFECREACRAAEGLIEDLPEHEFAVQGQLVADASVREVDHRFQGDDETIFLSCVLLLREET